MAVFKVRFLRGLLIIFTPLVLLGGVFAETPTPALEDASQTTKRYQEIIEEINKLALQLSQAQNQEKTLAGQIIYFDNQTKLTNLKITAAKNKLDELVKQIDELSGKIIRLDDSLSDISAILISRIVETYKRGITPQWEFLVRVNNLPEILNDYKYLKTAQAHDKNLMYQMEATKRNYREQKDLREIKKKEAELLKKQLEGYKVELVNQKVAKQKLLEETRNDEKKYQELLALARAELEAIQAIIGGKGIETQGVKVSEGQRIASVIQGGSCNSSGTHLHFIASKNGASLNPFSYLKTGIDIENCSGSSCQSSDGDAVNPNGDWNWPINSKIKVYQGYGYTWAVRNTWVKWIYNFHSGIDIDSESSSEVKAVKNGTLYKGSYMGVKGCRLQYVRLDHDDSDIDTLYLHVNY